MTTHWGVVALLCAATVPGMAQADTLYRCKAYSGGVFWSSVHCQQRQALVDRIVTVPPGLSRDQQVRLAEQGTRASARDVEQASRPSRAETEALQRQARAQAKQQARCQRFSERLDQQDSLARQGGSGKRLARIEEHKRRLRAEQSSAGC